MLLSEETTVQLLLPGTHVIEPNTEFETKYCGLIPIRTILLSIFLPPVANDEDVDVSS